ncbi:MAG: DUF5695 domain-containing protein [Armatimonadota bacterium]
MKHSLLAACLSLSLSGGLTMTTPCRAQEKPVTTPAVLRERTTYATPRFTLTLFKDSQTVSGLAPKGVNGFDFAPSDRDAVRSANGFYQLGDMTLRVRRSGTESYQSYSTALVRQPVLSLPLTGGAIAVADLGPTLPADCPLQVTRTWAVENGELVLRFAVKNRTDSSLEIGALGIPMVFNNIISDRNLEQAHATCSFSDPYIGQDAGYIQVTRLSGQGPALVVVPDGKTPLEGYQLLREPTNPNQTFEGMFEWLVHTRAYAGNEWKTTTPWNPPTDATLAPGQTRTYGVRFLLSDSIRNIETTLAANRRPLVVGIPGYILPMDQNGKLFLKYGGKVSEIATEPKGAIAVRAEKATRTGWKEYTLSGKTWGRVRLTVTYDDGTKQAISYYITKPAVEAVADLGNFLTTKQWFTDTTDPFHRAPSAITYDREKNEQVLQDSRVWISGLSDEGGAGSWLAAGMKEFAQPRKEEVAKYEQFVDEVLWGNIQFKDGQNKYGVRKSVFFYDPKALPNFPYSKERDWRSWTSWNQKLSEDIGRGYNYPHVVAAYWAMYRIARNHPGMVTRHPWQWYLDQAYETTAFMFSRTPQGDRRVGYVELGLMEGTVFAVLLDDLKREKRTTQAAAVEALMRERADRWKTEAYPFGSEMAWDSTGQEEVYAWCRYFGLTDKAKVSLNSILGYMPTLPHWGYNGNARRYWDFLYGGTLGRTSRIERQFHHYGSGLNALPVLTEYRDHPDDFYLLRVGYGGMMGALSNIDLEGFASAAFHSFPSTLKWDPYTGDYGPNFFGHALNTGTYLIDHPDFGWQAFGGNVQAAGDWVTVSPKDSERQRVYIAPRGVFLTLDAGTFEKVALNRKTHVLRVTLSAATPQTPQAFLRIEQPAAIRGVGKYHTAKPMGAEREASIVPLGDKSTVVELTDR